MNSVFTWPVRVYYEDVDLGGIVYYANYMKFMERSRTEWLRAAGIDQLPLKQEHGLIFAVVDLQMRFHKPAHFDDVLQVNCEVAEVSRASLTMKQQIHRDGPARALLLEGQVRVACLDANTLRPRSLPAVLTDKLRAAKLKPAGVD